jgi:ribonuclease HI
MGRESDAFSKAVKHGGARWVAQGRKFAEGSHVRSLTVPAEFLGWHDKSCEVAQAVRCGQLTFGIEEPSPSDIEKSHSDGSNTYSDGTVHGREGAWSAVRYDRHRGGGQPDMSKYEMRGGTVGTKADSFVAEEEGLAQSLEWEVAKRRAGTPASTGGAATFWTDSLGNVLSLAKANLREAAQARIYRALNELVAMGITVAVNWVRSHDHSIGNSLADLYAAEYWHSGNYDDHERQFAEHMLSTALDARENRLNNQVVQGRNNLQQARACVAAWPTT